MDKKRSTVFADFTGEAIDYLTKQKMDSGHRGSGGILGIETNYRNPFMRKDDSPIKMTTGDLKATLNELNA